MRRYALIPLAIHSRRPCLCEPEACGTCSCGAYAASARPVPGLVHIEPSATAYYTRPVGGDSDLHDACDSTHAREAEVERVPRRRDTER
jgi:hypothetical protein